MKNNFWFLVVCILMFFVGYNINNVAISFPKYKVATVNIGELMTQSSQVKALKTSQDKQMKDLDTLITKAQTDIANEPDRNKAVQMELTYRKEIESKKNKMDEEYNKQIVKITSDIKSLISTEAKKENYNLVLPTGMVISGGDDITNEIIKKVK